MTGSKIIGGLTPCNVVPEEILTDHPRRFRAMLVESGNPAHSIADRVRMREALTALELVVVIDVAFTETARLAHYVLPVASQFEKAESNLLQLRIPQQLLSSAKGTDAAAAGLFSEAELHARLAEALGALPNDAIRRCASLADSRMAFRAKFFDLIADRRLAAVAPLLLYRAIGDLLPEGLAEGAGVWLICQSAAPKIGASLARAGFIGSAPDAADALFDALLGSKSAVIFAVDEWGSRASRACERQTGASNSRSRALRRTRWARVRNRTDECGVPLRAVGRRAALVHCQHDLSQPGLARKRTVTGCAAHASGRCDARIGVLDGGRVRLSTRRGTRRSPWKYPTACCPDTSACRPASASISRMQTASMWLTGVAPNDLTRAEDRDWIAGTPWHKHTPARVEVLW